MTRTIVLFILSLAFALPSFIGGVPRAHAAVVFWTELGSIYRLELDGSDKQRIFTASANAGNACGLAIDRASGQLYWYGRSDPSSLSGHGLVARMNLDGSDLQYIDIQGLGTTTYGFDIDPVNGRMYIGEHAQMKRANLGGTDLVNLPIVAPYSGEIEVDSDGGRVYYTENGSGFVGIRSANLAGGDIQDVLSGDVSAFSMDYANRQVYMSEGNPDGGMGIKRADFGSSELETLIGGLTLVNSVETDILGGKVYWMTNTLLQRADLDGSNVETLSYLGGSGSLGKEDMILYLDDPTVVPAPSSLTCLVGVGLMVFGMECWKKRRRRVRVTA